MTNKVNERFSSFQLKAPAGIAIASGAAIVFGHGTHVMSGVAADAQATTNQNFDSNSGYLTFDFNGAFFLSVQATTLASPSAGAAIKPGDAVYYVGGTFDPLTGITYGGVLCADSTGNFFGIAATGILAGVTATIAVILKSAA